MPETIRIPPVEDSLRTAKRGWKQVQRRIDGLVSKYATVEARLTTIVARALIAGTLNDARERRRLRQRVSDMLRELDADARSDARTTVEVAYSLGMRIAAVEPVGAINREGIALLQRNLVSRLAASTTHVGRRTDDVFRREGLRLAAEMLGRGDAENASGTMVRRLQDEGVTAFTDRNGRRWGLERYAKMAVTTITAEAVFQGTTNNLLARGFDVVRVSETPAPCVRCKPYDGNEYSLTGTTPGFKRLDVVFPIHPECNHFVLPSPQGEFA